MDDVLTTFEEKRILREDLTKYGFLGSRIHISRASVFSHPDTGDHEYFLRIDEGKDEAITRLLRELDETREKTASSLPKP